MTRELHELCCSIPQQQWQLVDDERADETVHCADVEFTPGDWPKTAPPLRYVVVRIRKRQGLLFASGCEQKFLAVVSNRFELDAVKLLRWHWEKAGTIEHIHDVSKNELAARTPPSSHFGANAAWYRMSLITYNILSAMKALALPSNLSNARPKKLRFALCTARALHGRACSWTSLILRPAAGWPRTVRFNLAGKIVSHAGDLIVRISDAAERLVNLIQARARLLALAATGMSLDRLVPAPRGPAKYGAAPLCLLSVRCPL